MQRSGPTNADAWGLVHLDVGTAQGVARAVEELVAFAEHGRPEVLPALARLLVAPSWPLALRRQASAAVGAILSRTSVEALVRVDAGIRETSPSWGSDAWDRLRPSQLAAVIEGDPHAAAILGLLSCHANGHVREAAVRALAMRDEGLAWLLLRVNDWVAQVRIRATTAVVEQLDVAHAEGLLACLPLVWRLPTLTRLDHRELLARVTAILGDLPMPWLQRALGHEDRRVRRAVVRLLHDCDRAAPELVAQALDDVDSVVRLRAARLLAHVPSASTEALRERLCRDRSGTLRALGLDQLVAAGSDRARPWLERGLHDPHRGVRETARHWLRQVEPRRDFAMDYRTRLAAGPPSHGSVRGLGETGIPADWERLVPALDADRRTASAALEALRRLDAPRTRELRLMMVDDPRLGVSRDAARSVTHEIWATDEDVLREYLRSPLPHVRRHAMRLAVGLPKWRPGLILLAHEEPSERRAHEEALSRWSSMVSRHRVEPTDDEARALRVLLSSERWRGWAGAAWVRAQLDWVAPQSD